MNGDFLKGYPRPIQFQEFLMEDRMHGLVVKGIACSLRGPQFEYGQWKRNYFIFQGQIELLFNEIVNTK
jgi:hypothetical protein